MQVMHEWRAREGLEPSVFEGELSLYLLNRTFAKEDLKLIVDTKKVTGSVVAMGGQFGFHKLPNEFHGGATAEESEEEEEEEQDEKKE